MPLSSSSPQPASGGPLGPPSHVRLGPLTQQMLAGALWYGLDRFPAWQVWADDVEQVLAFLQAEGRIAAFLDVIQKAQTPRHRNAFLAEAQGPFQLARNGFRIVQWEPPGEGTTKGDVLVSLPGSPLIFVEVKQPGWQGEHKPRRVAEMGALSPEEKQQCFDRMKQDKYLNGEGGAVAPHVAAMDVVRRNALPKLTDQCPNLVIVVDDLRLTPVGLPGLDYLVEREFSNPDHDPDDPDDVFTYERLGGMLFLHLEPENSNTIYYYADFVENSAALPRCALPPPVRALLSQMRDVSRLKCQQQYADRPSVFDILRRSE